ESLLKKTAESTSKHLRLTKIMVRSLANYVFVRFSFDTQDAMGMNMVTIATQKMTQLIEEETGIECLSVAGNFDIDKKPAWLNFIENKGIKAWAEIVIPEKVVQDSLKTTPEKIFDVWLSKCMIGSAMSGALGFNAHFANIIAALFIATGQDPAHVVEGSMGITTAKVLKNGDLYFSIYLPALMLGTVGGGTNLATQKEALTILGIENNKVEKLAEIVAGTVLAGELSLIASLSEGSLAKAHQELGR
ncbi:MAG TPA: 3-hydroxy-3-methylglutaryl-CoA reductase, partial [Patescibacteria group bacterium]